MSMASLRRLFGLLCNPRPYRERITAGKREIKAKIAFVFYLRNIKRKVYKINYQLGKNAGLRNILLYFLMYLEYRLMKIIQYRNNNAIMPIQYGFSKTGFGRVLRYAITLIVTITESTQTMIFRSLLPFITHIHISCV